MSGPAEVPGPARPDVVADDLQDDPDDLAGAAVWRRLPAEPFCQLADDLEPAPGQQRTEVKMLVERPSALSVLGPASGRGDRAPELAAAGTGIGWLATYVAQSADDQRVASARCGTPPLISRHYPNDPTFGSFLEIVRYSIKCGQHTTECTSKRKFSPSPHGCPVTGRGVRWRLW